MDYEEMKFKMVPMHWEHLRRMLGVNEIPEPVMVRYFQIKKITDKISAPISIMDLLRIAMDCGFDVATGKFMPKAVVIEQDEVGPESVSIPKQEEVVEIVEEVAQETIDEIIEEVNEDPNPAAPITDVVPEPEPEPEPEPPLVDHPALEVDTQIEAYIEGDLKLAVVKASRESAGGWIYDVVVDGETIEISEDDIE